ncbi:MAG: hypothetical protein ACKV2T_01120 [Kofleriaceae bacterium]
MKAPSLLLAIVPMFALVGCATEDTSTRDERTDDVEDLDAKLDGAAKPLGLYTLIDPNSFEEGWPRMVSLDLRRDGTFYVYDIGPVDNNGNFEEGYSSYFGKYTLTKDRYNNKYIRLKPDNGGSWREKYKLDGTTISFFYRTGEVGWRMKSAPEFTPADRAKVEAAWEANTGRRKITNRASAQPDALWSRFYDLRQRGDYTLYTFNAAGVTRYAITGEGMVEVYAANNQLLAAALDGELGWEWTADL